MDCVLRYSEYTREIFEILCIPRHITRQIMYKYQTIIFDQIYLRWTAKQK